MILFSFFTGWLLSASFAPINRWYLAPLAIALWMWLTYKSKHSVRDIFIVAFTFNAFLLHWSSTYVGSIPWLILCLGESLLYLPLALARRERIYLFPFIFLLLEQIRSQFPFGGFGWARLAFSQADAPYRSVAQTGGVSLLTSFVLLIGYSLVRFKQNLLPVILIIAILVVGFFAPTLIDRGRFDSLVVQGNVPHLGLDFNSQAKAVFLLHVKETQKAIAQSKNYKVILWPENSVDVDPYLNKDVSNQLKSLYLQSGRPLIIGAVLSHDSHIRNASILWRNSATSTYIKQHLTPFGEYIPLRSIAQYFSSYTNQVSDFSAGNTMVIHHIDNVGIGPIICFELIDDAYINRVSRNSELLLVQTNNATFGTSAQSLQQLSISRIRAIENHRDLISVSTTGVSAVIGADGRIIQKTQIARADYLFASSHLYSGQTWANKLGIWAFYMCLAGWLLVAWMERRRNFSAYR
jgi:apolipoprotein N-acyltransferase